MSKLYYVLDTEQQSDTCREQAFQAHISESNDVNYNNVTAGWSETMQRATDGKYIVPYCEHLGDLSYVVEPCEPEWFAHERPYGL